MGNKFHDEVPQIDIHGILLPLTGSGSPVGVVTPTRPNGGVFYQDTATGSYYVSNGPTNNDWQFFLDLSSVTVANHATQHQHGGTDEVATATPAANAIPKAGAGSTLADGWIAESNVTQHEGAIDHDALTNFDANEHRPVNDAGTSSTELWSAQKIDQEIKNLANGIDHKEGVVTTTYNLGNITLSGEQTLNGVLTSGSRVLVVEQTVGSENGIYITAAGAWTRATDANEDAEVTNGNQVNVLDSSSTEYKNDYILVTPDPIIVGTTTQTWERRRAVVFGTSAGTSTEGNDTRVPSQDENDALQGTQGTPSNSNRYVTDQDTRLAVNAVQQYYVGKHGSDSNDGLTHSKAFLTFGAAITAAQAQTPSTTNRFSIVCHDAGVYTENLTLQSWIRIEAPEAKIAGTIILADDSSIYFDEVETASGNAITKTISAGIAFARVNRVIATASANGVVIVGATTIVFEGELVEAENGFGIVDVTTAGGLLCVKVQDINVTGTGTGLGRTLAGTTCGIVNRIRGTGQAILCLAGQIDCRVGTIENTTGINVDGGVVNIDVNRINSTTAYDVAVGATLNLQANEITGTQTNLGTTFVQEINKSKSDNASLAVDQTTTSAVFTPVPLSLSYTKKHPSTKLRITLSISVSGTLNFQGAQAQILVDGTPVATFGLFQSYLAVAPSLDTPMGHSFTVEVPNLAVGARSVTTEWRTNSGTLQCRANTNDDEEAHLTVREVY